MTTATFGMLMFAAFIASVGLSVVLPHLPYFVERITHTAGAAHTAWHTGLLTGAYTFAVFLFAPAWGRLSDGRARRRVLLIGLFGLSGSMLSFTVAGGLTTAYAERFVSGLFAAAVIPAATALVSDSSRTEPARARRLAFMSIAGTAGLLLGPMLGLIVSRTAAALSLTGEPEGAIGIPLATTAVLALATALALIRQLSGAPERKPQPAPSPRIDADAQRLTWMLFLLTFIASSGIGVFEVALALRGKEELGFSLTQITLMFGTCGLVMLATQAFSFSRWIAPAATRRFVAPAFALFTASLVAVPWVSSFATTLIVTSAVAAAAGILTPILTYWISTSAPQHQGAQLGKQIAAVSLGADGWRRSRRSALRHGFPSRSVFTDERTHCGRLRFRSSPALGAANGCA